MIGLHMDGDCSAGSVWRLAMPRVSTCLVPVPARRSIARALLPLPMGSAIILERGLGGAQSPVDVSLCVTPQDGSAAVLAGRHPLRALPPGWLRQPEWRAVRSLFHWWGDSRWLGRIPSVWLEFDGDRLGEGHVLPSVFVDCRAIDPAMLLALGADISNRLIVPTAQSGCVETLRRLEGALPTGVSWQFLGVMLPRDRTRVRACVALPTTMVARVWAALGVAPDPQQERMLAIAARNTAQVVLHLDVGDRIGPRVGLELKPDDAHGWSQLLSRLSEDGVCSVDERTDLLAFPGVVRLERFCTQPGGGLDLTLTVPDQWCSVAGCRIVRTLNHVKLVCSPGETLTAKVYLHLGVLWRHRRPGDGGVG